MFKIISSVFLVVTLWSIGAIIYGNYETHSPLSPPTVTQPWDEGLGYIGSPNAGIAYVHRSGRYYGADYCNVEGYGVPAGEQDYENGSNWLADPYCNEQTFKECNAQSTLPSNWLKCQQEFEQRGLERTQ